MTQLFLVGGVIGGAVAVVIRALLVDETRGRIRRRVTAGVEATIASLPQELQDEWGEELRADLEEVLPMPLTALLYARNLRLAAQELVDREEPALAGALAASQPGERGSGRRLSDRRSRARPTGPPRLARALRWLRSVLDRHPIIATYPIIIATATATGIVINVSVPLAVATTVAGPLLIAAIGRWSVRRPGR
jgi:hypothetical protein